MAATRQQDRTGSGAVLNAARSYSAEAIGAFVLVFAITATATDATLGAAVAGGAFTSLSVALVNGIVLAALVGALGHVSGAHLNPAVTLGLATIGRFPWREVPGYLLAQLVGSVLAALATWAVTGEEGRSVAELAVTKPAAGVTDLRALLTEVLITFLLVFVVTSVTTDVRALSPAAPVAIGSALTAAVFIGGPATGAAVNPVRALGPEIVSGTFTGFWIFLVGPVVGGVLAAVVYDRFIGRGTPVDGSDEGADAA